MLLEWLTPAREQPKSGAAYLCKISICTDKGQYGKGLRYRADTRRPDPRKRMR